MPPPIPPTTPVPLRTALTEPDSAFIKSFTKELNLNHIVFGCKIYDLNGKKVALYWGQLCLFESKGNAIVATRRSLLSLDHTQKVIWAKNSVFLHHSLKKS